MSSTSTIIQSPYDKRQYRILTLPNKLTCLLIAEKGVERKEEMEIEEEEKGDEEEEELEEEDDEHSDDEQSETDDEHSETDDEHSETSSQSDTHVFKAAAAMCVNIGHFSDPANILGLAHFCEHMLFFSNKKYPSENGWESFLSSHGGSSNASTDSECTIYQFDIHPDYLYEGLDRFSQFFISPLFDRSALDREVKAVNSEFEMALQQDTNRVREILFGTSRKDHVFSKFSWGNKKSLIEDVKNLDMREELVAFYDKYYSANLMKLVVLGTDLDELEREVTKCFTDVPNKNLKVPSFESEGLPFTDTLGYLFSVPAIKNAHVLEVMFQLESLNDFWRTKPVDYIGHILGHESNNSLLSSLRGKGWATSVAAGTFDGGYFSNTSCWLFCVSIGLTETGTSHKEEIIGYVFHYLDMIKSWGPQENIWKELKSAADVEFLFREKIDSVDFVEELSANFTYYPNEYVLSADTLLYDFKPEIITRVLDQMTYENCRVTYLSPFVKDCDFKEPWFGAEYKKEKLGPLFIPSKVEFKLEPNVFLPDNFDMVVKPILSVQSSPWLYPAPTKVFTSDTGCLWHKLDLFYNEPRIFSYFNFNSPIVYSTPRATVLCSLFLLSDELIPLLYPSTLVGYSYNISAIRAGIELKVNGYSQKIHNVFDVVIHQLKTMQFKKSNFDMMKEKLGQKYANMHMQVWNYSDFARLVILQDKRHAVHTFKEILPTITIEELAPFRDNFLNQMFIEGYVAGNCTEDYAIEMFKNMQVKYCDFDYLKIYFRLTPKPTPLCSRFVDRLAVMEPMSVFFLHPAVSATDNNSSVDSFYQFLDESPKSRAMGEFIAHMMYDNAFDQLRTKEQLGYSVQVRCHTSISVFGLSLYIVSSAFHPFYVKERIDSFIKQFKEYLINMTNEDFDTHRQGFLNALLEPDQSLGDESNRLNDEIVEKTKLFNRPEIASTLINEITKDDIVSIYSVYFDDSSKRNLNCCVFSRDRLVEESMENVIVQDCYSISGPSFKFDLSNMNNAGIIELSGRKVIADWSMFKNTLHLLPALN